MSFSEFLEEYPLYRKFEFKVPETATIFPKDSINMYCDICNDTRTFILLKRFCTHKDMIVDIDGYISYNINDDTYFLLNYLCASCKQFERYFVLYADTSLKTLKKIGQYPPWDIFINKDLKDILKNFSDYYQKGLICESQGYGIGANAYYRRIVDDIIGNLLEEILEFVNGKEKQEYEEALIKAKKSKNAQEKISLVKELLPPVLMTQQFNPLKTLYDTLSEGIHSKTDEECLYDAALIRTSLIFLVNSILKRKKEQIEYAESMKRLVYEKKKTTEHKES